MLDHFRVGIVDFDSPIRIFFLRPCELFGSGAADCYDVGGGHAVEESADMALAHAAKACHGDVDFSVLFGGHLVVQRVVMRRMR